MHARLLGLLIVSLSLGLALAPAQGGAKEKPAKEPPPKKPGGEVVFQVEGELTAKDPLDRILKKSFCQVHKIKLEAGKTYCMELFSAAFDPFLRLEDEVGTVLAEDDDGAGGSDSRIVQPIKEDRIVVLVATTFKPGGRGPYRLVVRRMNPGEADRLTLEKRVRDLIALGGKAYQKRDYSQAVDRLKEAIALGQKLYPEGHRDLAQTLSNLGAGLKALGEPKKALPYYEQALTMRQKLYPKEDYPKGHPDLATSLNSLGSVLHDVDAAEKALPYYEQALVMNQELLHEGLGLLAENEALDRFGSLPLTLDAYLGLTRSHPGKDANAYGFTWNKKGALSLLLQRRSLPERLALAEKTSAGKKLTEQWHDWLALRRRIDQFRDPSKGGKDRDKVLAGLTEEAERLERKLMAALPALKESQELAEKGPDDLLKALPRDAVLIDFLRYTRFEFDAKKPGPKGEKRTPSYVAFMSAGGKLKRIELEQAADIDTEATLWHRAVSSWKASLSKEERADLESQAARAAQNLKRLLWDPLAPHLPEGTKTLYLAPDGDLGRIPWAALPVGKDRILLEDYQIALVPHGPFLLQQLERKAKAPDKEGVLVLGGVEYGGEMELLKGTKEELDLVRALAKETGKGITPLSGPEAKVAKLREELPLARFAHLSTHGFFDETAYAEEMKRQERHQEALRKGYTHDKDKLTVGGYSSRNTLAFVGLVLAGAGEPEKADEDRGILTGTGILELPLDMDLAVLTACETGLGARSGAEGVQGLQRAFHVAGCRNVIASLWKVDDKATVALMAKFYHELWRNKKAPLDALREAQLVIYRHPELIPALAGLRVPDFEKAVAVPAEAPLPVGTTRTPTRLWAGFVLSGLGR